MRTQNSKYWIHRTDSTLSESGIRLKNMSFRRMKNKAKKLALLNKVDYWIMYLSLHNEYGGWGTIALIYYKDR